MPSKRLTGLRCISLVLLLGAWAGCRGKGDPEAVVAARVNGEPIPFEAFWQEFRSRSREAGENPSPRQEVMVALKRQVLTDLVRQRLLLQEAARRGIRVSEEALDARVAQIREGYPANVFQKTLLRHPLGYEAWRLSVRDHLTVEALYREVGNAAGKVTEEEIERAYRESPEEFFLPETVRVRQLLVQDHSLAFELYRRIEKGDDFAQLAGRHSLAAGDQGPGQAGIFRRSELPQALEEAAFSTPVGQVTPPIGTTGGFCLLLVEARTPGHRASLDEVRGSIARKLREERQEAFHHRWVETLVRDADIRINEAFAETLREGETETLTGMTEEARDAQSKTP